MQAKKIRKARLAELSVGSDTVEQGREEEEEEVMVAVRLGRKRKAR